MKTNIFAAGLSLAALAPLNAQQKPNVVFIIADDLGYGDLSCFGQEKFQTPNIDRLALNGTRFTRSYSGTTVSAPSRASLMTGLHTGHTPIRGNKEVQPEGQAPLPTGTFTLFQLFKDAGYATGAFGKWGLGYPGSVGDPQKQGVDEFFGYNCQRLAHNYYPSHLWHNQTKIELPENDNGQFGIYSQDLIQSKALEFIDNHAGNPFFLFVPMVLPHAELVVPEDSIIQKVRGKFDEKPFKGTDSGPAFRNGGYMSQEYPHATHAAMVMRIDVYVGQIIEKLKEAGVYENTLIVFTSDNGPHLEGGGDPDFFNSNGIYRGYKRDLYEGGIRVPTIVSWQGKVPSGKESSYAFAFWDYMPTFAALLGTHAKGDIEEVNDLYQSSAKIDLFDAKGDINGDNGRRNQQHKAGNAVLKGNTDGVNVLPVFLGQKDKVERDYFYFEFLELNGRQAVIQDDWKLLHLDIRKGGRYELYNLASDPSENHNLIDLFPEKAAELKKIMKEARIDDPNWPLF